jgi:hypothetical protein
MGVLLGFLLHLAVRKGTLTPHRPRDNGMRRSFLSNKQGKTNGWLPQPTPLHGIGCDTDGYLRVEGHSPVDGRNSPLPLRR